MTGRRILLISHDMTVTGAPNSLLRHAKYLSSVGYEIDVWTMDDGDLMRKWEACGFTPEIVPTTSEKIKNKVDACVHKYALVICNTVVTYEYAYFWQQSKTPVIWFIRETVFLDIWYARDFRFAAIFKQFYNLYCPSAYAAKCISLYNKNVQVVPNSALDTFSGFTPLTDCVRFGFLGSAIHIKGIDILVPAFIKAQKKIQNIKLAIAGCAQTKLGIKLQKKYSQAKGISWLGELRGAKKQAFFDSIDVLVVPSREESFGLSIIEGAMRGKAIITTDKVGANFIVGSNAGVIVKSGDTRSLANAIIKMSRMKASELLSYQCNARNNYLRHGSIDEERSGVINMAENNLHNVPTYIDISKSFLYNSCSKLKFLQCLRKPAVNLWLFMHGRGKWTKTGSKYF